MDSRPFTVTFITPSQSVTSGGTFAIREFARQLTPMMRVNLAIHGTDLAAMEGVAIHHAPNIAAGELPDADATVLYINSRDAGEFFELPESKGERLMFFQGYHILDDPMVQERLARGLRVFTVSRWLCDEIRRFGGRPLLTPLGLDREIFFPGPPTEQRSRSIAMMHDFRYWKGAPDGIEALALVKQARPDVEVRLFGIDRPEEPLPFPAEYQSLSSQKKVADLLRESAIFMCSSWEEGFGLPGLEAQVCGAALATTDTKGCREYAIDEETALVCPPRKPALLAECVVRLLDDIDLRRRLTERGPAHALERFKPWPEAGRVMAQALMSSRLE